MSRVAVIGSGIAGLAAAWLLSRRHDIVLFERENRLGGHTHTHTVETPEGPVAVDSGFIVHNEVNYPLLCRLLRELGVPTAPSDMSFAVSSRPRGFTWSSRGLSGLFAQRSNLLRPRFWRLLREIHRFNRRAPALLGESGADAMPISAWLRRERFTDDFRDFYLFPMAASVWSTPPAQMAQFPAGTLVRFFHNHGFLGVATQYPWRTIPGGCSRYIEPLTQPYYHSIRLGHAVRVVERSEREVTVHAEGIPSETFDEVVFAAHGHQVLPMLAQPTREEQRLFKAFGANRSEAWLHTDERVLPKKRRAWASWNHLKSGEGLTVTYHMNRLQPLPTKQDWFVSLNAQGLVDEQRVKERVAYEHPRYTVEAVRAQTQWAEVSGRNRTHYCGAYWGYGFHEDGLRSAVRVAKRMGVEW